ncbi:hypothetical protein A8U91_02542 [Halomonas elongata]|uniref:Uncharacterized protein n=1 Tax=Halomonas elongata TaxID=2746 RepID=A0A1B8P789_HALEL|nr:hypothetical protein [Halomonas elongata]OBX38156.1 hypothetical protein A8U91_02542 [Halomonas elongata]
MGDQEATHHIDGGQVTAIMPRMETQMPLISQSLRLAVRDQSDA